MNFMEAIKAMKEGKIVQSKGNKYKIPKEDKFGKPKTITDDKEMFAHYLCLELIEATDWEIVGDTKTLSDKIFNKERFEDNSSKLFVRDVKEAIKKYRNRIVSTEKGDDEIAEEIFGERLI